MTNQGTKQVKTDEKGFIKETLEAAEKVVKTQIHVEEIKERASHAMENGVVDAKRLVKKARYATEDLVDDTAHYIKHEPWRSVGVTFGVGFGLGAIVGLLVARKTKWSSDN